MNSAKPITGVTLICVTFFVAGCSKSQLTRFAPPGIVKYEEIASEKPMNPAIEQKIAERKTSSNAVYPVLAQQPGQQDRPSKLKTSEIERQIDDLVAVRDTMNARIAEDREDAATDASELDVLRERRDVVTSEMDAQSDIAKRERRAPLNTE